MNGRSGMALLGVLWVVVLLGTLAIGGVAGQRLGATTTLNRVALARARWAAEGCLAIALARLDSVLAIGGPLLVSAPDTLLVAEGVVCANDVSDPGALLHADSAPAVVRDRLVEVAAAMGLPRESLQTTDGDGRVNVNTAHPAVLSVLPGFTAAATRVVLEQRARGGVANLEQIANRLFASARDSLVANLDQLMPMVRFTPAAVVVTAAGRATAGPGVRIEALVVALGRRAAVIRRRMW